MPSRFIKQWARKPFSRSLVKPQPERVELRVFGIKRCNGCCYSLLFVRRGNPGNGDVGHAGTRRDLHLALREPKVACQHLAICIRLLNVARFNRTQTVSDISHSLIVASAAENDEDETCDRKNVSRM